VINFLPVLSGKNIAPYSVGSFDFRADIEGRGVGRKGKGDGTDLLSWGDNPSRPFSQFSLRRWKEERGKKRGRFTSDASCRLLPHRPGKRGKVPTIRIAHVGGFLREKKGARCQAMVRNCSVMFATNIGVTRKERGRRRVLVSLFSFFLTSPGVWGWRRRKKRRSAVWSP